MSDHSTDKTSSEKTSSLPAPSKRSLYYRLRNRPPIWVVLRDNWPWLFVVALLLAVGWMLVKPAPPSRVVMATGTSTGSYQWFAKKYAAVLAESGVTLEIRETAGSIENYTLLNEAAAEGPKWSDDGVSVAIVQSGTCPEGIKANIRSIASLYLEPIWIFYRGSGEWQLPDLRNKRVAAGPDGSGTRSLLCKLLEVNKIAYERASGASTKPSTMPASLPARATPTTFPATQPAEGIALPPVYLSPYSERTAAAALRAGQLDAAAFVFSPRHPIIKELLSDPTIRLMSIERHEAYSRNFAFLSDVKLPRGAVDLARDLPAQDTYLLAPAANLICREGTHPAIITLLIKAAIKAHERGDLLSPPGKMPSTQYVEFPVDQSAEEYFRSGPPLLQRLLPFSIAAFVDRMKILILPLLTLIIPLARLAPPLYVWRIRSRIYRWYGILRTIDRKLRASEGGSGDFKTDLATLQEMDLELAEQEVPLSYMEEFYNLRLHTDFLRKRVEQRVSGKETPTQEVVG